MAASVQEWEAFLREKVPMPVARRLSHMFSDAKWSIGMISEVQNLNLTCGSVRLILADDNDRFSPEKAVRCSSENWTVHGFHGTVTANAMGILKDRRIKSENGVVYFSGVMQPKHIGDMIEHYQGKVRKHGHNICRMVFEVQITAPVVTLTHGGTDAEEEAVRKGAMLVHMNSSGANRWRADQRYLGIRSIWVEPNAVPEVDAGQHNLRL